MSHAQWQKPHLENICTQFKFHWWALVNKISKFSASITGDSFHSFIEY